MQLRCGEPAKNNTQLCARLDFFAHNQPVGGRYPSHQDFRYYENYLKLSGFELDASH